MANTDPSPKYTIAYGPWFAIVVIGGFIAYGVWMFIVDWTAASRARAHRAAREQADRAK